MYVGITDINWYRYLRDLQPDETNFWRPGGSTFRALQPGDPFLFKLHAPHHAIVGGGWFVRYAPLPVSLAWRAFGVKNGVKSVDAFLERIRHYRKPPVSNDPTIGSIILTEPFFFDEEDWVDPPRDWKPQIVQGRGYDPYEGVGAEIWASIEEWLKARESAFSAKRAAAPLTLVNDPKRRRTLVEQRIGQGAFRVAVTDAYERRCAITGERTLPVLEAAHIMPHASGGPNDVRNGLLLRSDLHLLFDGGYVTIDQDHRVRVSSRIREAFQNGREYYRFDGEHLAHSPSRISDLPDPDFLAWHGDTVFERKWT